MNWNLRRIWHNGLGIVVALWILVGLWALTMPVAFVIWAVGSIVVALVLYFAGERLIERGAGRR